MPQALSGKRSSVPKVVRVNADDNWAVLYRNLGNGRRLPFLWATSVTLASGTVSVVVSSGVSFSDHDVSSAKVVVTPTNANSAHAEYYIAKDTSTNKITLTVNANTTSLAYDVLIMLGVGHDFASTDSNQIWKKY
jgi:hypothetical protein